LIILTMSIITVKAISCDGGEFEVSFETTPYQIAGRNRLGLGIDEATSCSCFDSVPCPSHIYWCQQCCCLIYGGISTQNQIGLMCNMKHPTVHSHLMGECHKVSTNEDMFIKFNTFVPTTGLYTLAYSGSNVYVHCIKSDVALACLKSPIGNLEDTQNLYITQTVINEEMDTAHWIYDPPGTCSNNQDSLSWCDSTLCFGGNCPVGGLHPFNHHYERYKGQCSILIDDYTFETDSAGSGYNLLISYDGPQSDCCCTTQNCICINQYFNGNLYPSYGYPLVVN
jgi:hypothetical protein